MASSIEAIFPGAIKKQRAERLLQAYGEVLSLDSVGHVGPCWSTYDVEFKHPESAWYAMKTASELGGTCTSLSSFQEQVVIPGSKTNFFTRVSFCSYTDFQFRKRRKKRREL